MGHAVTEGRKVGLGPFHLADRAPAEPEGRLQWHRVDVQGHSSVYGHAGSGPVAVFLHGWGLDHRSYQHALAHLVRAGLQVFAPALPGFGGTPPLDAHNPQLADYGDWVADFLSAVGVEGPVVVMGHSFGGGVSIVFSHRHPERVKEMVLINSIGGAAMGVAGSVGHALATRPLWDWGLHISQDVWPIGQARRVLPVIFQEALPNMAREPRAFWHVAGLARRADLSSELEELKRRELPVVILWGNRDTIITHDSFDALCHALGRPKVMTVDGTHSWLIADPKAFGEVMTNVLGLNEEMKPAPRHGRRQGDRSGGKGPKDAHRRSPQHA